MSMTVLFFGGDGEDRGGKPLAFTSQIPDYISLVLRQSEPHETDDEFDPSCTLNDLSN